MYINQKIRKLGALRGVEWLFGCGVSGGAMKES